MVHHLNPCSIKKVDLGLSELRSSFVATNGCVSQSLPTTDEKSS
uniref:Uncharacterized protein n=1 Tax=Rhizobium rhizogenes TaxID=359 RepID=A0A4P8DK67_RHIRH|nr:hypothetical protein pOC-C5.8_610 [Rhizobium rhizogenes]